MRCEAAHRVCGGGGGSCCGNCHCDSTLPAAAFKALIYSLTSFGFLCFPKYLFLSCILSIIIPFLPFSEACCLSEISFRLYLTVLLLSVRDLLSRTVLIHSVRDLLLYLTVLLIHFVRDLLLSLTVLLHFVRDLLLSLTLLLLSARDLLLSLTVLIHFVRDLLLSLTVLIHSVRDLLSLTV